MKNRHRILIIDDDADDREIIREAFAGEPHEFMFMENGEMLMEFLAEDKDNGLPSLILLDLNMPGKDGRETLKEVKSDERYAPIPIIILTTSSSPKDRENSYGLGANCFITKPDNFNEMVQLAKSIARLWLQ